MVGLTSESRVQVALIRVAARPVLNVRAGVAQLATRFAPMPKVLGSNPAFTTKHNTCLCSLPVWQFE